MTVPRGDSAFPDVSGAGVWECVCVCVCVCVYLYMCACVCVCTFVHVLDYLGECVSRIVCVSVGCVCVCVCVLA